MRSIELPIHPGLNVLVGKNGAGKSRLLQTTARALQGLGTRGLQTHVVFRVVEGDPDSRTSPFLPAFRALSDDEQWTELVFEEQVAALIEHETGGDDQGHSDAARLALCASGYLAWVQVGTQAPRLWAAVDPTTESEALGFLETYRDAWDYAESEYDATHEFDDDDYTDYTLFGHVFEYLPGEVDPTEGHLLPVPVVPLSLAAERTTNPTVLTDDANLAETLRLTREEIAKRITPESLLGAWIAEAPSIDDENLSDADLEYANVVANVEAVADYEWPPPLLLTLSMIATDVYRSLYPEGSELRCSVAPMTRWLQGDPVEWHAKDQASGSWVDLGSLSASQSRWATLAVYLTVSSSVGRGNFTVFDEPERGFHRAAELRFAQGLGQLPHKRQTTVLVASHSPLIAALADNLVEVERDQLGAVVTRVLGDSLPERLEALGMLPQDVLTWSRVILIVEGHHDRVVFERLLGTTLQHTRTLVLPIGGIARPGSALNAEMVSRFGPPKKVVVVDALGSDVELLWQRAMAQAAAGESVKARLTLDELGKKTAEAEFLRTAGHALLESGSLADTEVVALSVPDVIELLPAEAFVKGRTWPDLRAEYGLAKRQLSFKPWLEAAYGVDFADMNRIQRAMDRMDGLPEDVTRVRVALERAAFDGEVGTS